MAEHLTWGFATTLDEAFPNTDTNTERNSMEEEEGDAGVQEIGFGVPVAIVIGGDMQHAITIGGLAGYREAVYTYLLPNSYGGHSGPLDSTVCENRMPDYWNVRDRMANRFYSLGISQCEKYRILPDLRVNYPDNVVKEVLQVKKLSNFLIRLHQLSPSAKIPLTGSQWRSQWNGGYTHPSKWERDAGPANISLAFC
jgi:hypothetical protein